MTSPSSASSIQWSAPRRRSFALRFFLGGGSVCGAGRGGAPRPRRERTSKHPAEARAGASEREVERGGRARETAAAGGGARFSGKSTGPTGGRPHRFITVAPANVAAAAPGRHPAAAPHPPARPPRARRPPPSPRRPAPRPRRRMTSFRRRGRRRRRPAVAPARVPGRGPSPHFAPRDELPPRPVSSALTSRRRASCVSGVQVVRVFLLVQMKVRGPKTPRTNSHVGMDLPHPFPCEES